MQDVIFSVSSFLVAGFVYIRRKAADCLFRNDLHDMYYEASDYENCKQWCADHNDCGGFAVWSEKCYFKALSCVENIFGATAVDLYLKKTQVDEDLTDLDHRSMR